MARRGHGEGSIYRRKDGRYAAAITLENRKRKTFYGKTRREVQEKLNAALHDREQGTLATGPQLLLRTYLEHWLEQVYKPTVKLLSYQQYRSIVRNHLVPVLGNVFYKSSRLRKFKPFIHGGLMRGWHPGRLYLSMRCCIAHWRMR